MIKRDRLSNHGKFPLKKSLTVFLIIVFFTYTNCSQHMLRTGHKGALFACRAKYIQGSSSIPLGRGGILVLLNESINYEYEDFTLNIPYQNILDIDYSKNIKNIIAKFPEPNYQMFGGLDFLLDLLSIGILAIVVVVVGLLLKKIQGSTYMTVTYEIDGQSEWSTFKIRTSDINKLMPILNERIDIH